MDLSIIIVSHNSRRLLNGCLTSIYKIIKSVNFEVVLVDNASTDGILKMIEKDYPQVISISNNKNVGFGIANNQGAQIAKGQFLLFLNPDTELVNDHFFKTIKWIKKQNKKIIFGCQLLNEDKTIQPSAGFFPKLTSLFFWAFFIDDLPFINLWQKPFHQENPTFYKSMKLVDWVTGAFMLMEKAVFKKVDGFDKDIFMYMDEVDFCYRAKQQGINVIYGPQIKVKHVGHEIKTWRQRALIEELKNLIYFFKKHKPKWQQILVRFIIKLAVMNRIVLFGILKKNEEKKQIYLQAFKVC